MRKLVTVVNIEEIRPIEGADRIECVRVRGWVCVVLKGSFQVGDKAVFFEPDSFLPIVPQFEFLAKGSSVKKMLVDGEEKEGYRLKTTFRLKTLSQGLALPVTSFPELANSAVGDDVTDLLGVRLYEPPMDASLAGEAVGPVPGVIPKTDEERIQNGLMWLDIYRGKHFTVSVKIDGTSTTIYRHEDRFGVCGHNLEWKDTPTNSYWRAAHKYDLEHKLPVGYAIQAELAGESIQSNRMLIKGHELYVFYVWDIKEGQYLLWDDMVKFVMDIGLQTVPLFDHDFVLDHTLEQILALANGPCPVNPKVLREGLVFRLNEPGPKMSFKAISNEYLSHYGL